MTAPFGHFYPTRLARGCLVAGAIAAATGRFVAAAMATEAGDLEPLTAFGFTVVFPLTLVAALLSFRPSRTREGVLMRIGTAVQLILIATVSRFSLHLLLGMPVVFLCVELFETRLPLWLRGPVEARLVAC